MSAFASATIASAGSPDAVQPLRVATFPTAPFVVQSGERLTGFSIDLWNAVALRASLTFTWSVLPPGSDLVGAVQRGDADVAIAVLAITPKREQSVDFSYPYFDSGLQIMVRAQTDDGFLNTVRSLPWLALAQLAGASLLILVLLANLLWLIERRNNPDFRKPYLSALGEGLWGAVLIIATGEHGDRNAPGVLKRLAVAGMWVLGIFLIAHLTATVTSSQTVQRLRSTIRGPEDLPGKTIATLPGTVAADYLTGRGLPFVGVTDADDAVQRLLKGDVQAVVYAAPTLQYLASRRGQGLLQVVGPVFRPERIGIAVAANSPLRKRINTALDELYEDGTYTEIKARWFGSSN